ncbi:MAG: PaaI family thioesterase [Acidobacteria bacterium]|nr:PaaI family thioesterase [Acidobacteriota bacterium]
MKKAPKTTIRRNFCYACGADNPQGMRLKFNVDPEGPVVRATFSMAHRYQGPPNGVHGGIIATLVDEAMGKLSRVDGVVALTAELNVEYLRPVPLGRKIIVEARPAQQRGRSYWRECTIHDANGTLLVRGKGRFVKVAARDHINNYE